MDHGVRTSMDLDTQDEARGFLSCITRNLHPTSRRIPWIVTCIWEEGLDDFFLKSKYTMGVEDVWAWQPEKWGYFTVRSAYHLLVQKWQSVEVASGSGREEKSYWKKSCGAFLCSPR